MERFIKFYFDAFVGWFLSSVSLLLSPRSAPYPHQHHHHSQSSPKILTIFSVTNISMMFHCAETHCSYELIFVQTMTKWWTSKLCWLLPYASHLPVLLVSDAMIQTVCLSQTKLIALCTKFPALTSETWCSQTILQIAPFTSQLHNKCVWEEWKWSNET